MHKIFSSRRKKATPAAWLSGTKSNEPKVRSVKRGSISRQKSGGRAQQKKRYVSCSSWKKYYPIRMQVVNRERVLADYGLAENPSQPRG